MILICEDCGAIIDSDDIKYTEDFGYNTGAGWYSAPQTLYDENCSCGGTFVDAVECVLCGSLKAKNGIVLCDDCIDENATLENTINFSADTASKVEINDYLAQEFTADEIEQLLIRELKEAIQLGCRLKFKEYCDYYKDSFADWIVDKEKE